MGGKGEGGGSFQWTIDVGEVMCSKRPKVGWKLYEATCH